jgi:hypothetical protein
MLEEEGGDVQVQKASSTSPKPSSIQVIQNIYLSPSSSSSSSSEDLFFPKIDLIPSTASRIVKVTHSIVTEIRADMVPKALMSSSVRDSWAVC